MQVIFYNFTGENNEVNKVLSSGVQHDGYLKESCDYISPTIEFQLSDELLQKNYVYIPKFNAYYFVTGRTITNKSIILSFDIDELMTFRNEIKQSYAQITRSNIGDLYLPDNRITNLASHNLVFRKLGEGFEEEHCYVLTVAGSYGGVI